MSHKRPYDVAMSPVLRDAVTARRAHPDGELLNLRFTQRGTTRCYSYPWDTMKLGDFFLVPMKGQKYEALSVRFRQAAARRDWELTIVRVERDGEPHLRVCLTLVGVRALKEKAQHYHGVEGIRFSDGKWSETRKRRYEPVGAPKRRGGPKVPLHLVDASGGTSPAHDGPVDATLSPDYDRAAILKQRLKAAGA